MLMFCWINCNWLLPFGSCPYDWPGVFGDWTMMMLPNMCSSEGLWATRDTISSLSPVSWYRELVISFSLPCRALLGMDFGILSDVHLWRQIWIAVTFLLMLIDVTTSFGSRYNFFCFYWVVYMYFCSLL